MSGMCRRLGMSAAAPSCSCPPTACALEMPSPSSWPDTPAQEHADTVREALNFGYGGDPNYRPFYEDGITALDALLAEVERLTAERDAAMASNAVFMSDEAYSRLHDAWHVEQERAEAAEALAERRLADLRTYWTHCGYPEWYGDEERAWLHAALTDAGRDADGDGDAA